MDGRAYPLDAASRSAKGIRAPVPWSAGVGIPTEQGNTMEDALMLPVSSFVKACSGHRGEILGPRPSSEGFFVYFS